MAGSARNGNTSTLDGVRILLVEDDFLILMDLEDALEEAGAEIVAQCRSVDDALDHVDDVDIAVAVLDLRLGNETVAPVARRLAEKGVPFLFYTGQLDDDPTLAEWSDHRLVHKPARSETIIEAVAEAARG
jgi:DNA-binding NarL/FixJ family response regulator